MFKSIFGLSIGLVFLSGTLPAIAGTVTGSKGITGTGSAVVVPNKQGG